MSVNAPLPDSLTALSFSEQITLWSVRYWVNAHRDAQPCLNVLKDAYRLAKMPDGLTHVDNFMTLLLTGNCRTVDIRCLCCAGISDDEWRLLQSLALAQSGNKQGVARLISSFLEPSTTRMAVGVIGNWSHALQNAGHQIPLRKEALEITSRNFATAPNQPLKTTSLNEQAPAIH